MLSDIEILKHLNCIGCNVKVCIVDECDSTNNIASDLLKTVQQQPFVVLARKQTSGRGRLQRSWFSDKMASICMSVAYDMAGVASDILASATVRIGIEVCNALNSITNERVFLKWPNDIYSKSGKKIAGMLAELKQINGSYKIIFGIGIIYNLSISETPIPNDLLDSVDDIFSKLSSPKSKNEVSAIIINAVIKALSNNVLPDIEKFSEIDWLKNKQVDVSIGNRNFVGVACGINAVGNLLVRLPDDRIEVVNSGEATMHKQKA